MKNKISKICFPLIVLLLSGGYLYSQNKSSISGCSKETFEKLYAAIKQSQSMNNDSVHKEYDANYFETDKRHVLIEAPYSKKEISISNHPNESRSQIDTTMMVTIDNTGKITWAYFQKGVNGNFKQHIDFAKNVNEATPEATEQYKRLIKSACEHLKVQFN